MSNAPAPKVQLLHHPRLLADGGRELPLADKDAAMLAMLALDGPTPRAHVAALLWPGQAGDDPALVPKKAANNLRQRVFRINRWAGCEVVVHGRLLSLADGVRHDLVLADGVLLDDRSPARGELLGRHEYAGGELAAWVDAARRRWRSLRADRVLGLVTRLESESRLSDALRLAARLVAEEPLLEHASRILMRLHHRRGDRAAAQAEFERCRRALYEHSGDAPSDETVELAVAIARSEVPGVRPAGTLPLALRHPPRTVGRAAAADSAELRWQQGGAVLLLGAPGIGKTRLLGDLVRRWSVPVLVQLAPHCADSSYGLLSQLAQALRPHLGTLPAALPDAGAWLAWLESPAQRESPLHPVSPGKLAAVVAALLAAAARGGCRALAVEDLHFADSASLDVLCELLPASGAATTPQRWLLSSRDTELPAALGRWLDRQSAGSDPALRLQPLAQEATRELLATIGLAEHWLDAAAERLHRHCGGHPLFMLQVLRQLQIGGELDHLDRVAQLPLPEDAMSSASHRLTRADPVAQQMAFLAALCGGDFTAALMCRLLRCNATTLLAPWHRLEDLHIFGAQGFAHDLIRQAVLAAVPRALVPLLHRDVAEALHELGADPQRLASHWEAAGDAGRAAEQYQLAAQGASACGLQGRAIEHLERAARLYRQVGRGDQAFRCQWRAGHLRVGYASARDAAIIAGQLAAEAATPVQQALAAELHAKAAIELHQAEAVADAEHALQLARQAGEPALQALSRMRLGAARALFGEREQALAELQRVAAEPQHLDDDMRHELEGDLSSVLASLGRREEALARFRDALDRALAARELSRASFVAGSCATQLSYLGRLGDAVPMAERAVALAREAGVEKGSILVDEMGLAGNLADLGRFDEALALGERVLRELTEAGMSAWAANAANDRAVIYLRLGRFDLALHLLDELPADAPAWVRGARKLARARVEQWRGRECRTLMDEAVALFEQGGVIFDSYPGRKVALTRARELPAAQTLEAARAAVAWAAAHQHVAFERYAQMVEVEALTRLGRTAEAAAAADTLGARPGLPDACFGLYWPELLAVLADAWAAAGRPAQAAAAEARAAAWIEHCAAAQVPPVLRESFLTRNPVNQRLLQPARTKRRAAAAARPPVTRG